MAEEQSELVAVKLDEGWFLSLRKGNPSHGLMISEDAARLLNATGALLLACRTAKLVIKSCQGASDLEDKDRLMADSALVQLQTAIDLADGSTSAA